MILIDALYINYGGGLNLLKYLIRELENRKLEFFLLTDARCSSEFRNIKNKETLPPSLFRRYLFYKEHDAFFSAILCFANIPPLQKQTVPVYTYFHNINLLTLDGPGSLKGKAIRWAKRKFIKLFRGNTDLWFVQTDNTALELSKHLSVEPSKIKLLPFYYIPISLKNKIEKERTDYIFVGDYSGAKGHDELLKAWGLLYNEGCNPILHLTVDKVHVDFIQNIRDLTKKGLLIINHGVISFEQVVELYKKSKALIYPSMNESLGLGLIEAVEAGCDVIASDLPFTYAVCNPSGTFDPRKPKSIAEAIVTYEKTEHKATELKIKNKIDQLIDCIYGKA